MGVSPKDTALQIAQECNCAIVNADDDATVDYDWYAANNGLRSPRHLDDEDDGPLMFADLLGDVSGGTFGESAELLAKGEERELLKAFFWIVQRTAQKKRGNVLGARIASESNNFYFKIFPCVYILCVNILMPLFGYRLKGIPLPLIEWLEHQKRFIR